MPRNIEDIIVPERRRSIRDIPIPEGRRNNNGHNFNIPLTENKSPTSLRPAPPIANEVQRSRKGVWIAGGIALLVLIVALLAKLNGPTWAFMPKSQAIS